MKKNPSETGFVPAIAGSGFGKISDVRSTEFPQRRGNCLSFHLSSDGDLKRWLFDVDGDLLTKGGGVLGYGHM